MNCRPGDLARIVPGHWACECLRDKFVTVLDVSILDCSGFGPGWLCEGRLGLQGLTGAPHESTQGDVQRVDIPDSWLRPIRDNPGEDQTLQWAGHPLQHTAHDVAELHKQVDRLADIARQLVEIQKLL